MLSIVILCSTAEKMHQNQKYQVSDGDGEILSTFKPTILKSWQKMCVPIVTRPHCHPRKIVSFKLSSRINTQLAMDTLNIALSTRGDVSGLMFHTDRGSQFTSKKFRQHLDSLNIVQSFSAKGHPYDNAVMECFFKYMKKEETDRRNYQSLGELNQSLFTYINGFYNSVRPHSHNNGLTPNQKEALLMSV